MLNRLRIITLAVEHGPVEHGPVEHRKVEHRKVEHRKVEHGPVHQRVQPIRPQNKRINRSKHNLTIITAEFGKFYVIFELFGLISIIS